MKGVSCERLSFLFLLRLFLLVRPPTPPKRRRHPRPLLLQRLFRSDTITKEYDAWLRKGEQKTREGCRRHNRDLQSMECQLRKLVIYGDAPVAGSPRDPDWISNRANAFAEAQLLAYQKFAQAQSLTHQYEFLRRYVNDTTPLPEEPQRAQTQLGAMMDKVLALGSAYLDKFLRELDVDPALY